MAKVRLSVLAQTDFDQIISYLEKTAGPAIAKQYAHAFRAVINRLGQYPGSGAPRAKFGKLTRILIVSPYLIFYDGKQKCKVVDILRILHGRRKISKAMIAAGRRRRQAD